MTGSTPARSEGRDPSPTEVRKVPELNRSDSSEEVEPWDERRTAKKSSGVFGLMEGAGEMMTDNLNCFAKTDDDGLEEGDLPSLSRPSSRPRPEREVVQEDESEGEPPSLLGVQKNRSTTRPLSPPSEAGAMTVEERRLAAIRNRESPATADKRAAFFKQLDPPTPSDTERTFSEEGPDDEQADRRRLKSRRADSLDAPQREDEVVEEYESYGDLRKDSSYNSAEGATCIDYTLNTLSQMCGYGETEEQPRDHKWSKPHDDKWIDIDDPEDITRPGGDGSLVMDGAVEQTAIEVEYVAIDSAKESPQEQAPQKPKIAAPKWDTNRKNAYLAAMARKAKEDFEESNPAEGKSPRPDSPEDGVWPGTLPPDDADGEGDMNVEDVYSSFNPMERRKFLKLINSGMSSKEASNKILAEREESDKKKKKSLSFKNLFKRNKSEKGSPKPEKGSPKGAKSAAVGPTLAVMPDDSGEVEVSTPDHSRDHSDPGSPDSAFDGISAVPSGTPPSSPASQSPPRSPRTPPRAGTDVSGSPSTSMESADYETGAYPTATPRSSRSAPVPVTQESRSVGKMPKSEPRATQDATADAYRAYDMAVASSPLRGAYDEDDGAVFLSSESSSNVSEDDRNAGVATAAAAGAVAALAAGGAAAAVIATRGSDSDEDSGVAFEKSGNSYYDAVRKEVPEEDEDEQEEYEARGRKGAPKGSKLASIRSSPRSQGFVSLRDKRRNEMDSEDERPGQIESKAAGAQRDTPGSASKRRLLGIPLAGKSRPGFEALEDKDSASLGKNTMSEDIEDEMRNLEAEIDAEEIKNAPEGEEEVLDRIERELLRPGPASVAEDLLVEADKGTSEEQNDASFNLKTPKAMADAEASSPTQKIEVAGDLTLENYFDSTAGYSSPGPTTQDQISVVSGKSEYTARTGYTGASTVHTQSSRKRHKGAAKKRIAKARAADKSVESKKQGWHESIVAAAASTNRVWDPQKGWVDYEDPASAMAEEKSSEKLRVSLDGVTKRSERGGRDHGVDDTSQARSVDVPFPPEWERERDQMTPSESRPHQNREPGMEDAVSAEHYVSPAGPTMVLGHDASDSRVATEQVGAAQDRDLDFPALEDSLNVEESRSPKIRMSLQAVALKKMPEATELDSKDPSPEPAVPVPFPPEWEKERNEMVGIENTVEDTNQRAPSSVPLLVKPPESRKRSARSKRKAKGVDRTTEADRQQSQSDLLTAGKSVGWVESMRKATAGIEKDGQTWDPESGWVGVEKDFIESPQQPSAGGTSPAVKPPTAPVTGDFSTNRDVLDTFIEKSAAPDTQRSELSTVDSDQAVASSGGAAVKKGVQASVGSSVSDKDPASASVTTTSDSVGDGQPNKYVQLGDNGSVRSAYALEQQRQAQQPKAKKASDGSKEPKLASGELDSSLFVFPRNVEGEEDTSPLLQRAPQVDVVKEKCDEDDLNLFAGGSVHSVNDASADGIRTPPRKDRSGPVDLDELDDNPDALMTDSEDTDEDKRLNRAPATQTITVLPAVPATPPTPSESAADRQRKTATPVPKLEKNRRDTSPVHESDPQDATYAGGNSAASMAREVPRENPRKRPATPSSDPLSESQLSPAGDESTAASAASSVRQRMQQWESMSSGRKRGDRPDPPSNDHQVARSGAASNVVEWPAESDETSEPGSDVPSEWKSFFGKKVRAESMAAMQAQSLRREENQGASKSKPRESPGATFVSADDADAYLGPEDGAFPTASSKSRWRTKGMDDDDDSLFKFEESRREGRKSSRSAPQNFPDISPIPSQDEDEVVMEEIESNTGGVDKNSTFLQRLSTCAAPMVPAQLKNAKVNPGALCGRPDMIVEEKDKSSDEGKRSESPKKSRSKRGSPRSGQRSIGSEVRSSSSVASEDFGQKTAYLEAIAMKAAVSNPKRSGSAGRRRSPGSDFSSTSSRSERWNKFLEKKRAASGESSSRSNTEVSKAAEKYAAEKVEEMMSAMASRPRSAPRGSKDAATPDETRGPVSPTSDSSSRTPHDTQPARSGGDRPLSTGRAARKSDSAKAAEELAAARVEAMMAAMSSTTLDEGEI